MYWNMLVDFLVTAVFVPYHNLTPKFVNYKTFIEKLLKIFLFFERYIENINFSKIDIVRVAK
ncbi:hypothetical protein NIES4103_53970 [Nostoc sp. NIES-4103]|nr:hypothetical protein NIES4103_53970 [Nostoc sp. NIES-4103]